MNQKSIRLESTDLELVFEPDHGGKWRSLRDRRTGREWLWRNPFLEVRPAVYGESFVEKLDTGGWDEIFPAVSPCVINSTSLVPDHGDLVHLAWQVDQVADNCVSLSVEGRCLPFRFERSVVLNGPEVCCEYRLIHQGGAGFPWLWCAHPLIPLSPGLTLEIEPSVRFRVAYAQGAAKRFEGQSISWNQLPSFEGAPWAAKLFSGRGEADSLTLRQGDGSGLRFGWNVRDIPYLGLWVNCGTWSGCGSSPYRNIGVEPGFLPADEPVAAENPPVLEPGQVVEWSLRCSVD